MEDYVTNLFREVWVHETSELCKIATYREAGKASPSLLQLRSYLNSKASVFNESQSVTKFQPFTWARSGESTTTAPTDKQIIDSDYWVFGFRFGSENPLYKVAIICHLDTVPAQASDVWDPFHPIEEMRDYPTGTTSPQPFLVGRGTIDDKGPAVSAFVVARAIAKKFDDSELLRNVQIEISFDSSEETDMSTPHYLEDEETRVPDFGIVYDAFWCTRAEKGIERPTFTVQEPKAPPPEGRLYLHALNTAPNNSTNTVPDWAAAEIRGPSEFLSMLAKSVDEQYSNFTFDDPEYRRAEMKSSTTEEAVILRAVVAGAQHGSAPEENRAEGANPLVSLTNFLVGLVKDGTLASYGAPATICSFVTSTFGTRVFGEMHDELYKYDEVFEEGNGTTYAVTKTRMLGEPSDTALGIELDVDIRYATPHHEIGWDGEREGFLDGDSSVFPKVFGDIVDEFNISNPMLNDVTFQCSTKCPPDIRTPDSNPNYLKVERAYREVRGFNPPRGAIGGGTDAKGYTFLLAAGALFSHAMGPPINYHGISEAAPITDMELSTKVLYRIMELEVTEPNIQSTGDGLTSAIDIASFYNRQQSIERVKQLRKTSGFKHQCECCS